MPRVEPRVRRLRSTHSSAVGSRRALAAAFALSFGAAGCPSERAEPSPASRDVASEVHVAASTVDAISERRGISREQALELAGEDALLAQHSSAADPQRSSWLGRVVLARQLLAAFADEAKAGGPPTDAEVQAISEARFWELERPRMVQVAHAVVLSPEEDPEARALAERIG
ncbi:MAG TPA: hypothetical protein VMG12_32515, partial [Polyangiaceae bacterium]|nr:hypothetical protein [Polyangiaceae bacterium]